MSVNEELLPLRNKIDGLDSELVRLLNERAEVAKEIGEIKARAGLPVYRPEREAEVLKKICGKNEGPLPNESLVAIWREVMCACRGLESELKVATNPVGIREINPNRRSRIQIPPQHSGCNHLGRHTFHFLFFKPMIYR